MTIALLLAALIGLIHYSSSYLSRLAKPYFEELTSFAAGVGVAYLFLQLFPEFIETSGDRIFFIPVLVGFMVWHLVEKYIFRTAPRDKVLKELALEDSIISFVYHFILGMVLVDIASSGNKEAMLFFVPVALYTALSTLPVDYSRNRSIIVILSAATFLGSAIALFMQFSVEVTLMLIGFVIGTMTFTIIRHSIPQGKSGRPLFFATGAVFYGILIFLVV